MKPTYREWLEQQRYLDVTVNAQVYRAERVEEYYGDLDGHYEDEPASKRNKRVEIFKGR